MKKLLIANRGEIAVRIIRAAKSMGIKTVAVYSDADSCSLHTLLADEAVCLGEPEPVHSYINEQKILDAILATKSDAVHPGYGFLSEKSSFVKRCEEAGITFVGPTAASMDALGSKISAKETATKLGIPLTPGFFDATATRHQLEEAAERIGYPVMLKASAGGGGRGMRVVSEKSDFLKLLDLAASESEKAFGDGTMMVEKYIPKSRHIEIQVLADNYGNVHTLHERECSLQRKHQKVLEESHSPYIMNHPQLNLREKLEDCSKKLAKEVGYRNAGTVEFMVDDATGEFYFLEVNTRLQVEHPVTEELTGLDIVQHQLAIASGEKVEHLPFKARGHVIEARITAEDASKGFLPSIGKIFGWAVPEGPGIRLDTGVCEGAEISRYYDSMIAKLIVTAEDRCKAIDRLKLALQDFHILGVQTNIAYLLDILEDKNVLDGNFDTNYLEREYPNWNPELYIPVGLSTLYHNATSSNSSSDSNKSSNRDDSGWAWSQTDSWRNV